MVTDAVNVIKYLKIWKHVTDMKKTCDELVKHIFPGGKYSKSKSIFDRIEEVYNDLLNKEKTYILYKNKHFEVDRLGG